MTNLFTQVNARIINTQYNTYIYARNKIYIYNTHGLHQYTYTVYVRGKTRWSLPKGNASLLSATSSRWFPPHHHHQRHATLRGRSWDEWTVAIRYPPPGKSIGGDLLVWREHSSLVGYKLVVGKCRGLEAVDRRSPKQMSAENTSRPTTTPSSDEPPALPSESSVKK